MQNIYIIFMKKSIYLFLTSLLILSACVHAAQQPVSIGGKTFSFKTPKKSAHYESNTPAHSSVLPLPPLNVVVDVNFDLTEKSSISIMKDRKEYGVGATIIDANKLAMRRLIDSAALDGIYDVSYQACWPDNSCHEGFFQFAVDRSISSSYQDFRGQQNVTVNLAQIAFFPKDIHIKRGTKVMWQNDDDVEHYVNTDAHPSHTYFPPQNSRILKKGETFFLTFDRPGVYLYHCSAHASQMVGTILVD